MGDLTSFQYSLKEELANAITHGIAIVLSIAGLVVLVALAAFNHLGAKTIVAISIYGASMFFLYTASTLYHAVYGLQVKRIFQHIDRSMIYVLIAGTYTPFCLIPLYEDGGLWILVAEWILCAFGLVFQSFLIKKSDWINCLIYLIMGWLIVLDIGPIVHNSTTLGLWFLVSGGIVYSLGIIFFICRRIPYNHAIWHLFVITGTTLQYFSILQYVI